MSDLFKKGVSLFSTTLSTGIGTGTGETLSLSSVVGCPTDTEFTITIDRVDANGDATPTKTERITGTISGSNLTSYTRGVDSTSEQAHSAGAVIEYLWNGKDLNDIIDGILAEHAQDGTHQMSQINDSNGNEVLKLGSTASAVNEITITNKATGNAPSIVATGGDTNINLDIKGKGTGTVTKPSAVSIQCVAGDTDTEVADGIAYLTIPKECSGMNLVGVHARVVTAGTTGTTDIQIHNVTDSQDMLSTVLTIDSGETGSDTATTPAVIDTSYDDVVEYDLLRIDCDAICSGTAAQGLIVTLRFALP